MPKIYEMLLQYTQFIKQSHNSYNQAAYINKDKRIQRNAIEYFNK